MDAVTLRCRPSVRLSGAGEWVKQCMGEGGGGKDDRICFGPWMVKCHGFEKAKRYRYVAIIKNTGLAGIRGVRVSIYQWSGSWTVAEVKMMPASRI